MVKRINEREELVWRIVVGLISGIILNVWKVLIIVLAVIHWFKVLFTKKRDKELAEFCEYWNSEIYRYVRYMTFQTNEQPFPFTSMKRLGKFEKRIK
ncbi:MAG: DUF4389 domain-containing protein [Nanoarchaeota archaeon]|nr:DUF4389 domain-containing protein [Nanoarchaeota archaeon]